MEIRKVTYQEVKYEFGEIKPDLLDEYATYYGYCISDELVGIVSYVEHQSVIYLCHDFVKEEYRNRGVYKMLLNYRDSLLKESNKIIYAHCNINSLKHFINNGYVIEKTLFKVVKK
jgi:hypothetical protein